MTPHMQQTPQLSQRLTLTPSMKLALQILQMSTIELQAFLEQTLQENPLLELAEDTQDGPQNEPQDSGSVEHGEVADEPFRELDDNALEALKEDEAPPVQKDREQAKPFIESYPDTPQTFHESLILQLGYLTLTPQERELGEGLIDQLDEHGYLSSPVEEVAEQAGVPPSEATRLLEVIQTFDPPGVGARDLRECLLLQLRRQGLSESLSAQILRDHFPAFLKRHLRRLASACHRPVEEVEAAYALIQRLQPRPSRGREPSCAMPVIPDLAVRSLDGRYEVEWLDDRLPRLVMSTAYRRMLRNPDTPAEAKQFLQDRLRHATWVIRAVEQRATTLLAIARCILTVQRGFLEHGPQALKPLTHAQVAQAVGRHPSTVGRAIAGKSIDTPYGIIRLERFFASRVPQRHPNDVLSDATIKAHLQALIRDEDPSTPLSDEGMVAKLRAHGACVARRTVAKYRGELKILPAYLRRQARTGRDPATAASPPAPRRLTPTVF